MANWVKELLNNLDAHVDEVTKAKILGACGEKCPFTHLTDSTLSGIKASSKSEFEFLENLCAQWHLKREDGQYYVVFDQCYCPLVNDDTQCASKTLCYCTFGNIKHKFKLGLGRDVQVEMQKTILAGDDECRFLIKLEGV